MSGYHKDWGDWIAHSGGPCPCLGQYVQVTYGDGDIEEGIAQDHINWYYAVAYRVRREVEDTAPMRYKERELEPTL